MVVSIDFACVLSRPFGLETYSLLRGFELFAFCEAKFTKKATPKTVYCLRLFPHFRLVKLKAMLSIIVFQAKACFFSGSLFSLGVFFVHRVYHLLWDSWFNWASSWRVFSVHGNDERCHVDAKQSTRTVVVLIFIFISPWYNFYVIVQQGHFHLDQVLTT